jgi:hypothetical protein
MKKLLFITAIAVTFAAGLSSCSKCQVCTKENSNEVRICEKDYNSNTAYGFTIDTYEASGYSCKGSI